MTEENLPYQRLEGAQARLDDIESGYDLRHAATDSDWLLKVVHARVAIAQAKTLVMIEHYLAALVAKTPDVPLAPLNPWPSPYSPQPWQPLPQPGPNWSGPTR